MAGAEEAAAALRRLDEVTRRLRRECPWDREQDARSIVPHTVEEAYELADAVQRGDDATTLDELGDVLFQVHFLSLLLEERGAGDLAAVADQCREKLIRRHPHVFGPASGTDATASTPQEVRDQWDRIKRDVEGREPFADVPENLPALLYARKLQRRASTGGAGGEGEAARALRAAADELAGLLEQGERAGPAAGAHERDRVERAVGDLLFAAVEAARRAKADPELALRAAADRFRASRSVSS